MGPRADIEDRNLWKEYWAHVNVIDVAHRLPLFVRHFPHFRRSETISEALEMHLKRKSLTWKESQMKSYANI